jgi:hypothetical protein
MPIVGLPARRAFPSDLLLAEAHIVQFYADDRVLLVGLASALGKHFQSDLAPLNCARGFRPHARENLR